MYLSRSEVQEKVPDEKLEDIVTVIKMRSKAWHLENPGMLEVALQCLHYCDEHNLLHNSFVIPPAYASLASISSYIYDVCRNFKRIGLKPYVTAICYNIKQLAGKYVDDVIVTELIF
jgi:hypothetical protein